MPIKTFRTCESPKIGLAQCKQRNSCIFNGFIYFDDLFLDILSSLPKCGHFFSMYSFITWSAQKMWNVEKSSFQSATLTRKKKHILRRRKNRCQNRTLANAIKTEVGRRLFCIYRCIVLTSHFNRKSTMASTASMAVMSVEWFKGKMMLIAILNHKNFT